MSIIRVQNISKKYLLGETRQHHDTFRDAIAAGARRIIRAKSRSPDATSEFYALKDVNFEVERGEVVGIVGGNGAGKSTLLKLLSRITPPTEGRIEIRGRLASLLEVGTGFHPELTGRDNIFLNGAILGMGREEVKAKFDEIVDFAGVERFIDTPVKRYSSGMYVRLAFSVAAHLEPEILIVDEVLAVGDAAFQAKCLGKMGDVAKSGRTILFVSHNLAPLTQLCSRAIWLDHGRVAADGSAYDTVAKYLAHNGKNVAERTWQHPGDAVGDDKVRILAGRVIQNDAVAEVVDINAMMEVEIEYLVLQDVRNLLTGAYFWDANNICLFSTTDWRENAIKPGVYRKRVRVDAQTFAEGLTKVWLFCVFWDPDVPSALVKDALAFQAVDSEHPDSVRGKYTDAWPGVVRLRLDWSDAVEVPERIETPSRGAGLLR